MAPSLDDLMTPTRADGAWSWTVPDGWQQGRGAFGGIVVGAMLRAVQSSETDLARVVRSVTAELVGPVVPGPATIHVELLRRGNAVSTIRAWLTQSSTEILAHLVAVLGAKRVGTPEWSAPSPALPSLDDTAIIDLPAGIGPVFAQHFAFRPTGPYPYSGHATAEASGFVGLREPAAVHDAAWLALHADAYWLASMARFEGPRPAATVAFTLHIHGNTDGDVVYHRATAPTAVDGYSSETRELFTPDGRLLCVNHQLTAIIK